MRTIILGALLRTESVLDVCWLMCKLQIIWSTYSIIHLSIINLYKKSQIQKTVWKCRNLNNYPVHLKCHWIVTVDAHRQHLLRVLILWDPLPGIGLPFYAIVFDRSPFSSTSDTPSWLCHRSIVPQVFQQVDDSFILISTVIWGIFSWVNYNFKPFHFRCREQN